MMTAILIKTVFSGSEHANVFMILNNYLNFNFKSIKVISSNDSLNSPTDKTGENLNLSSTSFGFDRLILARKALIMLRF